MLEASVADVDGRVLAFQSGSEARFTALETTVGELVENTSLSDLLCADGQIAKTVGGEWVCARDITGPPPKVPGFTFQAFNEQGFPEYTHDQTGIQFVLLPGGKFGMGSPDTEAHRNAARETPVHDVLLDPFLIGKTEVTQAEYEAVMGSNPSFFTGAQRPVEIVSFDDLHAPDGFFERTGLSLPSEAQWEYAARGGALTAFSFGDDCNSDNCEPCSTANNFMWWCGNAGRVSHPVGEKAPNLFGLFDMHGNVWEWCEDVFDSEFYSKPEASGPNPVASSTSDRRVIRGGSWDRNASICRSANRHDVDSDFRGSNVGFRPAAPLP